MPSDRSNALSRRRLLTGRSDRAPTPPEAVRATIGDACLARRGVFCRSCADACPEGSIGFVPALRSAPQPRIDAGSCTGCGACAAPCPAAAITLCAALSAEEPTDG